MPSLVSKRVSSTLVFGKYRCVPAMEPSAGPMVNAPPSGSSSEPKIGGESKRGMHDHTTAPSHRMCAATWQLPINPSSSSIMATEYHSICWVSNHFAE